MRPLHNLKPRIRAVRFPYPEEIFGTFGKTLLPVRCVIVDVIETMATMLVNDDVVGRRGQHFHYYISEWFQRTEEAIWERWGFDVYLLSFSISCDKTSVDRGPALSLLHFRMVPKN
jgi:hypothetical protein